MIVHLRRVGVLFLPTIFLARKLRNGEEENEQVLRERERKKERKREKKNKKRLTGAINFHLYRKNCYFICTRNKNSKFN